MWGGGGAGGPDPPLKKTQVAMVFLRNSGMDTYQEAIGPIRSNCFSKEVYKPSEKYVDN